LSDYGSSALAEHRLICFSLLSSAFSQMAGL
jgi:hypothetical protein